MVTVNEKSSLGNAIELMFKYGIRNLVVMGEKKLSLLNDRNVLDYLLSEVCKSQWQIDGSKSLYRKSVGSIHRMPLTTAGRDTTASEAASLLSSYERPALLVEDCIVSPWDLAMK